MSEHPGTRPIQWTLVALGYPWSRFSAKTGISSLARFRKREADQSYSQLRLKGEVSVLYK